MLRVTPGRLTLYTLTAFAYFLRQSHRLPTKTALTCRHLVTETKKCFFGRQELGYI